MVFDIVLLGHHSKASRVLESRSRLRGRISVFKKHKIIDFIEPSYGTYAYLLSLSGAKKLLQLNEKITRPIDHYTGDTEHLNTIGVSPAVILIEPVLSQEFSNITETRNQLVLGGVKAKGIVWIFLKRIKFLVDFKLRFIFILHCIKLLPRQIK